MSVGEVAEAYTLTSKMKQWATTVTEPEFVATMSATAPLSQLTSIFVSIFRQCMEDISKVGGARGAVDTDITVVKNCLNGSKTKDGVTINDLISIRMEKDRDYKFNLGQNAKFFRFVESDLPVKGEDYVAIVYSGHASLLPEFKKAMPGVKLVTFDSEKRFEPTILGDYREFYWKEFGEKYGYPIAAVFMPPCGPRSRQHQVGRHYDGNHYPVSIEAVAADQCVEKAMHDIKLLLQLRSNFQFAVENPMYKKFTGLPSIQPFILGGQYAVVQYADYSPEDYTLKRTIIIHNLKFWTPKPITMTRNMPHVRWNSTGWNQEKRWSWPQQLSADIATAVSKALPFSHVNSGSLL